MHLHDFFQRRAHQPFHGRHGHDPSDVRCQPRRPHPFDGFGGAEDGPRGRGGLGGLRGGGRMLGHGDLRLLLLGLIEQQPRHGYELIRIIEDMFHGHYSPSPGAIYPTLTMLEEMGHAQAQAEAGGRKLYAITDDGRAYLDEHRAAVDAVIARTERSARRVARHAMPQGVLDAMQSLRHALMARERDWDEARAQRIAAVLKRAAADIAADEQGD